MNRRSIIKISLLASLIPKLHFGKTPLKVGEENHLIHNNEIVNPGAINVVLSVISIAKTFYSIMNTPKSYDPTSLVLDSISQISKQIDIANKKLDEIVASIVELKKVVNNLPDEIIDNLTQRKIQGALQRYKEFKEAYKEDYQNSENKESFYNNYLTDLKKAELVALKNDLSQFAREAFTSNNLINVSLVGLILQAEYDLLSFIKESDGTKKSMLKSYFDYFNTIVLGESKESAKSTLESRRSERAKLIEQATMPRISVAKRATKKGRFLGNGSAIPCIGAYNFKMSDNIEKNAFPEIEFLKENQLINENEKFYDLKMAVSQRVVVGPELLGAYNVFFENPKIENGRIVIPTNKKVGKGKFAFYTTTEKQSKNVKELPSEYGKGFINNQNILNSNLDKNTMEILIASSAFGAGSNAINFCQYEMSKY